MPDYEALSNPETSRHKIEVFLNKFGDGEHVIELKIVCEDANLESRPCNNGPIGTADECKLKGFYQALGEEGIRSMADFRVGILPATFDKDVVGFDEGEDWITIHPQGDRGCALCHKPITDRKTSWKKVTGWVGGPKSDSMRLREDTGEYAHDDCVTLAMIGMPAGQPDLFGES